MTSGDSKLNLKQIQEKYQTVQSKVLILNNTFTEEKVKSTCSLCNKKSKDVLFLPCSHIVYCYDCYKGKKVDHCVCGATIVGYIMFIENFEDL